MKVTVPERIEETPGHYAVPPGEWTAEPATWTAPGRQRRDVSGYALRRPGQTVNIPNIYFDAYVFNGDIIVHTEDDMSGEILLSIQRSGRR